MITEGIGRDHKSYGHDQHQPRQIALPFGHKIKTPPSPEGHSQRQPAYDPAYDRWEIEKVKNVPDRRLPNRNWRTLSKRIGPTQRPTWKHNQRSQRQREGQTQADPQLAPLPVEH